MLNKTNGYGAERSVPIHLYYVYISLILLLLDELLLEYEPVCKESAAAYNGKTSKYDTNLLSCCKRNARHLVLAIVADIVIVVVEVYSG